MTLGAGGLEADHLPFEVDPDPAPLGALRGDVARAIPERAAALARWMRDTLPRESPS